MNEYYEEYLKVRNRLTPSKYEFYLCRNRLAEKYSLAIPNDEAIDFIAKLSPIYEVDAGTGYWASLVKSQGGKIIAVDAFPPEINKNPYKHIKSYSTVLEYNQEDLIAKAKTHVLMLCWPPFGNNRAGQVLNIYRNGGGQHFIYIGESEYGCTGDENFHVLLSKEWILMSEISIPTWYGLHDKLYYYTRVTK